MQEQVTPVVNLIGEKIALGPLEPEHAGDLYRWHNDVGTMRGWEHPPEPEHLASVRARIERMTSDPSWVVFMIYDCASWQPVGYTFLVEIDRYNLTAEFGIMIGETAERGKGYGTEAARLMLDVAFTSLGLNNVLLRVDSYHAGAIKAYERAGFSYMGTRFNAKQMGGSWWDSIYMQATARDFESPLLKQSLRPDVPTE